MRRLFLAPVLLALVLAACARGGPQGSGEGLGTILGSVLLAPTCPVEQVSSPCPSRPLPHVLVRVVDGNGDVQATTTSDRDGRFVVDVRSGSYLLTASIDEDPARAVNPARVHVAAGRVTHANVLVDSGIR
jgi:Carboxypeptidase regulatory-like domain